MTFVVLHGAVGSWDEILVLIVAAVVLFGATLMFSRKKSD
jgi:hypothetical protein